MSIGMSSEYPQHALDGVASVKIQRKEQSK